MIFLPALILPQAQRSPRASEIPCQRHLLHEIRQRSRIGLILKQFQWPLLQQNQKWMTKAIDIDRLRSFTGRLT
jgi:hypothetical protein